MALITEILLFWVLLNYLNLSLVLKIICIVLFILAKVGGFEIKLGGGRVLKL